MSKPYGEATKKQPEYWYESYGFGSLSNSSGRIKSRAEAKKARWVKKQYTRARRRDLKQAMLAELKQAHIDIEAEEWTKYWDSLFY